MTRKGRLVGLLAVAAAATLTLAACSSSGGGTGGDSKTGTLTLWHYEGPGSAYQIAWNQAIKDFKKQHPGVTVQFSLKSFNQMQQNAPMILNSTTSPTSWSTTRATRPPACCPSRACSPTSRPR